MKFTVEIRDYEPAAGPITLAEIEDAIQAALDRRGDDGTVIVTVTRVTGKRGS